VQRYPLWKGLLLAAIMVAAILLALPNVYGESPALQLSRRDRGAFDDASAATIRDALAKASIPADEVYVDSDGRLWARFQRVDDQLKARDLIQRDYEGQYAIALTNASRAPDWLQAIGLEPMSLGLDLRGACCSCTRWTPTARWRSSCRTWSATSARSCATRASSTRTSPCPATPSG
jgi:preprotein translocase subunit SecD